MAYVYKIINKLNGKIYVGKTTENLETRWSQHMYALKREDRNNRPLYRAMNKYGISNFYIECIEECDVSVLSEREQYWISFYDSYKNGYNATMGGDGSLLNDYDKIVDSYLKLGVIRDVAKEFNTSVDTVNRALLNKGIIPMSGANVTKVKYSIKINMYSLGGVYLQTFNSFADAAKFISFQRNINYSLGIAHHIRHVCKGIRRSAYGYIWAYAGE